MKKIKINTTKKEAAEEVFELVCMKMENKNGSVIGISIDNNGNGYISKGFNCYNDTPDYPLIGEHDSAEIFGDVPEFDEWTPELKKELIKHIEEAFFTKIYDNEKNEYVSVSFEENK